MNDVLSFHISTQWNQSHFEFTSESLYFYDYMVFFNVKLADISWNCTRKTITPVQFTKEWFLPHVWKVKNPQSAGKYYICDWVEYSFCWLGIPHSRGKGAFTNYVDKILPIIAIYLYFWGNWFPEISENLISTDISSTYLVLST